MKHEHKTSLESGGGVSKNIYIVRLVEFVESASLEWNIPRVTPRKFIIKKKFFSESRISQMFTRTGYSRSVALSKHIFFVSRHYMPSNGIARAANDGISNIQILKLWRLACLCWQKKDGGSSH